MMYKSNRFMRQLTTVLLTACLAWSAGVQATGSVGGDDELTIVASADQWSEETQQALNLYGQLMAQVRKVYWQALEDLDYEEASQLPLAYQTVSSSYKASLATLLKVMVRPSVQAPLALDDVDSILALFPDLPEVTQSQLQQLSKQRYDVVTAPPVDDPDTLPTQESEALSDLLPHLLRLPHPDHWQQTANWMDRHLAARHSIEETPLAVRLVVTLADLKQRFDRTLQVIHQLQEESPDLDIALIEAWLHYQKPGGGLWQADISLQLWLQEQPPEEHPVLRQKVQAHRYEFYRLAGQPYPSQDKPSYGWNLLPDPDAAESATFVDANQQQAYEQRRREAWAFAEDLRPSLDPLANPEELTESQRQHLEEAQTLAQDLKPMLTAFDGGEGLSAEQQQRVKDAMIFAEDLSGLLDPYSQSPPTHCTAEDCEAQQEIP